MLTPLADVRQRVLGAGSALPPVEVPTHEALASSPLSRSSPSWTSPASPLLHGRVRVRAADTAAPVELRAVASLMVGAGPSAVRVGPVRRPGS